MLNQTSRAKHEAFTQEITKEYSQKKVDADASLNKQLAEALEKARAQLNERRAEKNATLKQAPEELTVDQGKTVEERAEGYRPGSVVRIDGFVKMVGLSKSTIYDRLNKKSPRYDPTFPKQIKIGASAVGWLVDEIEAWINACAAKRASDV